MKVSIYEQLVRAGATRRDVLKGGASMAALAAVVGRHLGRADARRLPRRTICARRS